MSDIDVDGHCFGVKQVLDENKSAQVDGNITERPVGAEQYTEEPLLQLGEKQVSRGEWIRRKIEQAHPNSSLERKVFPVVWHRGPFLASNSSMGSDQSIRNEPLTAEGHSRPQRHTEVNHSIDSQTPTREYAWRREAQHDMRPRRDASRHRTFQGEGEDHLHWDRHSHTSRHSVSVQVDHPKRDVDELQARSVTYERPRSLENRLSRHTSHQASLSQEASDWDVVNRSSRIRRLPQRAEQSFSKHGTTAGVTLGQHDGSFPHSRGQDPATTSPGHNTFRHPIKLLSSSSPARSDQCQRGRMSIALRNHARRRWERKELSSPLPFGARHVKAPLKGFKQAAGQSMILLGRDSSRLMRADGSALSIGCERSDESNARVRKCALSPGGRITHNGLSTLVDRTGECSERKA